MKPAPAHPGASTLRPLYFYIVALSVLFGDQTSKYWIQRMLAENDSRPLLGSAFQLTLTHNTGGAWGYLPQGNGLFTVTAVLAAVALAVGYHLSRKGLMVSAALSLALGGALGNLIDRIRHGFVVDFLDARIIHWPVFNVADSAISIGIILLMIHFLFGHQADGAPKGAPEHGTLGEQAE